MRLLATVEKQYSEEFLLMKTQEGVTDKVADHMANTRMGTQLAEVRALEFIARKRLERASESTQEGD